MLQENWALLHQDRKKSDILKEDYEIRCHLVAKTHEIAMVDTIQYTRHTINTQTKEKK